jgi:hypothetical protein
MKAEARVADRWLEVVNRDGQRGIVIDSEFMSVADARARLEAK